MKQKFIVTIGRRSFLRAVGIGAAAAGAASLATETKADSETADEKRKPRYKVTEHVKAYYRVNRYPK